jgi:hypothetical protein
VDPVFPVWASVATTTTTRAAAMPVLSVQALGQAAAPEDGASAAGAGGDDQCGAAGQAARATKGRTSGAARGSTAVREVRATGRGGAGDEGRAAPAMRDMTLCVRSGDGARFRRLWREVWRAVPRGARRRIRQLGPRIALRTAWRYWHPGIAAETLVPHVRFYAPYFDAMTDAVARYVIAEELAHLLQAAEGGLTSRRRDEQDANATARGWLGIRRSPRQNRALSIEARTRWHAWRLRHPGERQPLPGECICPRCRAGHGCG